LVFINNGGLGRGETRRDETKEKMNNVKLLFGRQAVEGGNNVIENAPNPETVASHLEMGCFVFPLVERGGIDMAIANRLSSLNTYRVVRMTPARLLDRTYA
jgi:hypothetical protein